MKTFQRSGPIAFILFLILFSQFTQDVYSEDMSIPPVDSIYHGYKFILSFEKQNYEKGEDVFLNIDLVNVSKRTDTVDNYYIQEVLWGLLIKNISTGKIIKYQPIVEGNYVTNKFILKPDSVLRNQIFLYSDFGNESIPQKNEIFIQKRIFSPGTYEFSLKYRMERDGYLIKKDKDFNYIVSDTIILNINEISEAKKEEFNDFYNLKNNEIQLNESFLIKYPNSVYYDQVFSNLLLLVKFKDEHSFNEKYQEQIFDEIMKFPESKHMENYCYEAILIDYINNKNQNIKKETIEKLKTLLIRTKYFNWFYQLINDNEFFDYMKRYEKMNEGRREN